MKGKRKIHFTFSQKLFGSVVVMFLIFVGCFVFFQNKRENGYRQSILRIQLEKDNDLISNFVALKGAKDTTALKDYIDKNFSPQLHVYILTQNGQLIFDNRSHLTQVEITSDNEPEKFYATSVYPSKRILVRSSLPYSGDWASFLEDDKAFLWFSLSITTLLIIVFYRYVHKLGTSINQLRLFAQSAEKNKVEGLNYEFPSNELGDISQSIVQIYKKLRRTKEKLYIEREKLISHLSISREGLAIYKQDKTLILSNVLFNQYMDILSDKNLHTAAEFFSIQEIQPLVHFINREPGCNEAVDNRRMSLTIEKAGRIFIAECVVFHDNSFEISINDITKEEEQVRLKRQLTQNISHELKTPVSGIQGYLETILNTPNIPADTARKFLERCYAQSNRLGRLLQDISSLNRMDEAPQLIDMETTNLTTIVRNVAHEMTQFAEEKQMKIIDKFPDNLPMKGNPSLLTSIFTNLFSNAIAYAGTQKTITLKCFRDDGEYYYFSFADNGVGVPPEHLSRLFERFYRVDKGRSRKLGGTGLGLAIVKNAIHLHGGSISAKTALGGGLEFVFSLKKNLS